MVTNTATEMIEHLRLVREGVPSLEQALALLESWADHGPDCRYCHHAALRGPAWVRCCRVAMVGCSVCAETLHEATPAYRALRRQIGRLWARRLNQSPRWKGFALQSLYWHHHENTGRFRLLTAGLQAPRSELLEAMLLAAFRIPAAHEDELRPPRPARQPGAVPAVCWLAVEPRPGHALVRFRALSMPGSPWEQLLRARWLRLPLR